MSNEIKIFESEEFGSVRTMEINGEPYFVGKDVAEILGYANTSKALIDHVDDEDKLNNETLSNNLRLRVVIITKQRSNAAGVAFPSFLFKNHGLCSSTVTCCIKPCFTVSLLTSYLFY